MIGLRHFSVLAFVACALACGTPPTLPDGGVDATDEDSGVPDAGQTLDGGEGADGGSDAGLDGGADAGDTSDAGFDAGIDAGFDAGIDAGFDAGIDAGFDAGIDAGFDAGIDAGFDAGIDAGFDAGLDAGEDAGTDAGCVVQSLNQQRAPALAGELGSGSSWASLSNAIDSSASTYASAAASTVPTKQIYVSAFGFSIPSDATLTQAFTYVLKQRVSGGIGVYDDTLQLADSSGLLAFNRASSSSWSANGPTNATTSHSLTGITPAQINDPSFGFVLSAVTMSSTATAQVYTMTMRVDYTVCR